MVKPAKARTATPGGISAPVREGQGASQRLKAEPAPAIPDGLLARLQFAGLRRTLATRAVLGLFLNREGQGLTHTQVFAGLTSRGITVDRVTLYRLLDRLAAHQVLRRQVDDERTFRYWLCTAEVPSADAILNGVPGEGPTFECQSCHQRLPLTAKPKAWQEWWQANSASLALAGHAVASTRFRLVGTCSTCVGTT